MLQFKISHVTRFRPDKEWQECEKLSELIKHKEQNAFAKRNVCYVDFYNEETTDDANMPALVLSKEESPAQIAGIENKYF